MDPAITIITCSLTGDRLEKTINSILKQTFGDWELVLVAPKVNTSAQLVVDSWNSTQAINSFVDDGIGTYWAMNLGAFQAHGTYLLFLNEGDEFHDENSLLDLKVAIGTREWAYGRIVKIGEDGLETKYKFEPYSILFHRFGWRYVPHPASIMRKSLFSYLGGFDVNHKIAADQKLFLQASRIHSPQILRKLSSKFYLGGVSSRSVLEHMEEFKRISNEVFGPVLGSKYIDDIFWIANTFTKRIIKYLFSRFL